jgi:hypothetical protein
VARKVATLYLDVVGDGREPAGDGGEAPADAAQDPR